MKAQLDPTGDHRGKRGGVDEHEVPYGSVRLVLEGHEGYVDISQTGPRTIEIRTGRPMSVKPLVSNNVEVSW